MKEREQAVFETAKEQFAAFTGKQTDDFCLTVFQMVKNVGDSLIQIVIHAGEIMAFFGVKRFGEHMGKDVGAQSLQKFVLRLKMGIESASSNIGPVDNILYGNEIIIFLFQQRGKGVKNCLPGLFLSSVHFVSSRTNEEKCSVSDIWGQLFLVRQRPLFYNVITEQEIRYRINCTVIIMGSQESRNGMRKTMEEKRKAIFYAILAAALYAGNSPLSKLFLEEIPAALMAGFLYLGAGIGIFIMNIVEKALGKKKREKSLERKELPYVIGMVVLDIAAPILLMAGLSRTTAANASLLNNFEIVATAVIALIFFHEKIGRRLWLAIALVSFASILLTLEDAQSLSFSVGSLLVLGACICWGMENNCTRMLSVKDPAQTVIIKGFGSGIGSLLLGVCLGERAPFLFLVIPVLALGFVSYGLSILFYIKAQRYLGAARTSTYYAFSPFIGVFLSLLIFRELPACTFWAAFGLMLAGVYLAAEKA